ncbi:expressed conserved protein [Echinococcus multilocularis]|uniref:Expressed conserved protein n=1 Tax=Echinococcus multilocularis TaxID=6211 RepID=A0A068YFE5_ECHMU|nr:expressed conserved protein [Echinococcus multilocularis]
MKFYILCLLVVAATAARPYKYHGQEYKPTRRFSEKYFPVYFKTPDRDRSGEGEFLNSRKLQKSSRPAVQQEATMGKVGYGRVSKGVQREKEEVNPVEYPKPVDEQPSIKVSEEESKLEYPYEEDYDAKSVEEPHKDTGEEEAAYDEDRDGESDEEDEDEYDEYEPKYYNEDEVTEEEEEDEEDKYGYEKGYKGDEGNGEEYEEEYDIEHSSEVGDEKEEGSDKVHEEPISVEIEKNIQTTSLKEADRIFSFPGCNNITCSKTGSDGYGCSDSKCKFLCSKTECYEYPDGPTTTEENAELEEVVMEKEVGEVEEEEDVAEEEEEETASEVTTTTITTTAPEPETPPSRKEARKRRGGSGKREGRFGKGKNGRGSRL